MELTPSTANNFYYNLICREFLACYWRFLSFNNTVSKAVFFRGRLILKTMATWLYRQVAIL